MRTLLIGYDLNQPGQAYAGLIEAIKALGGWWHYLDSTWLVRTAVGPAKVRDQLKTRIDPGDELLVVDVTGASWASWLPEGGNQWLNDNL